MSLLIIKSGEFIPFFPRHTGEISKVLQNLPEEQTKMRTASAKSALILYGNHILFRYLL